MNKAMLFQRPKIMRMPLWFFILLVCIGGTLFGCGSAADIPPSQQQAEIQRHIPQGKSLVCFYYTRKYLLGTTTVALDGKSSPIEKDTCVLWEVEPGEHQLTFTFERKWYKKAVEKTITCAPNQRCFFYLHAYTEDDEAQHKIVQASSETGQKKMQQFRLMRRFSNEAL